MSENRQKESGMDGNTRGAWTRRGGKPNPESTTASGRADQSDLTFVGPYRPLGDREPEAGSLFPRSRFIHPIEAFEHSAGMLRLDAWAAVADGEYSPGGFAIDPSRN